MSFSHNEAHTEHLARTVFCSQATISVQLYATCHFKNYPKSNAEYGREKDPCKNVQVCGFTKAGNVKTKARVI